MRSITEENFYLSTIIPDRLKGGRENWHQIVKFSVEVLDLVMSHDTLRTPDDGKT